MKYNKNVAIQLRHYSSTSQTVPRDASSPTTSTISVTERLAQLRTEQSRAATNRQHREHGNSSSNQQHRIAYQINPWPGILLMGDDQQMEPLQGQATRPAAGPPPPPSWMRGRRRSIREPEATTPPTNDSLTFQHYRSQLKKLKRSASTTSAIPSLVRICCWQLATDHFTAPATGLPSDEFDEHSWWINQFKKMPNHIKQRILFEWSFYDDDDTALGSRRLVTSAMMDFFGRTEYEELWLEASQISLERLIRAFWKINKVTGTDTYALDDKLVDHWEDLLSSTDNDDHVTTTGMENNNNNNNNSNATDDTPTVVLHVDCQEEIGKWMHLSHVMTVLHRPRPPQLGRVSTATATATMPSPASYALSSPFLGQTLVSLNISFMRPAPSTAAPICWTTFSHLIVSTLPHLRWLYSAGCFSPFQGSGILTVLSRGLRKLKFWDLGYHSWLHLVPLTTAIDWQRDLTELTTLCLSSPSSSRSSHTSSDITTWFKNHQLTRIKLIWMDK